MKSFSMNFIENQSNHIVQNIPNCHYVDLQILYVKLCLNGWLVIFWFEKEVMHRSHKE